MKIVFRQYSINSNVPGSVFGNGLQPVDGLALSPLTASRGL
jgi:hypothetical protein